MVYATYSEGFRSGGFNGRATGANSSGPYDPESVESFEVGFKTVWMDNTFQLNGSIFTVDYTCLLYTSPSPRDLSTSRMPSSA